MKRAMSPSYNRWCVYTLAPTLAERVRNTVLGWFK